LSNRENRSRNARNDPTLPLPPPPLLSSSALAVIAPTRFDEISRATKRRPIMQREGCTGRKATAKSQSSAKYEFRPRYALISRNLRVMNVFSCDATGISGGFSHVLLPATFQNNRYDCVAEYRNDMSIVFFISRGRLPDPLSSACARSSKV
jgi:hypothetical protein